MRVQTLEESDVVWHMREDGAGSKPRWVLLWRRVSAGPGKQEAGRMSGDFLPKLIEAMRDRHRVVSGNVCELRMRLFERGVEGEENECRPPQ